MKGICQLDDCEQPIHAKGFCKRHYQQQWSTGSPQIVRPNPRGTPVERFLRYVEKRGPDECWPWTGRLDKDGYGQLRVGSTQVRAHRFSYELHKGSLPSDQLTRHRCNTPACVNPDHLELGDHVANMRDRREAGHYTKGAAHPMAKVSDETVAEIRAATGTYAEIAARFGLSVSQIGNIKRGAQRG